MRRTIMLATMMVVAIGACGGIGDSTATYTGGACAYEGPVEFDLNSTVTFTVINESDTTSIGFAVLKFPEGSTAQEVFDEGIFNVVAENAPLEPYQPSPTVIGTKYEMTVTFNEAGQHGINCFDFNGPEAGSNHVTMFMVVE